MRFATSLPQPPERDRLLLTTAIGGLVATVCIIWFPAVRFAYHSPGFHIVMETAASLTAGLAALLFFGRLRQSDSTSNRLLVYALAVSALVNMFFSVLPTLSEIPAVAHYGSWASVFGRLVAAGGMAAAAFASNKPRTGHRRLVGWSLTAAALLTMVLVGVLVFAIPSLPPAVVQQATNTAAPSLEAHPLVLLLQGLQLALVGAAAAGFFRRANASGDELMHWLAAASLLAAFARLHYMLYPSLYAQWVYSGDFFRLGFYLLLVAGAIAEIRRYWEGLATAAAEAERRRLARELHDGVAQELAYIVTQTKTLRAAHPTDEGVRVIGSAAARALDESRRAIAALVNDNDEPLDVALAQAAEEVADRVGAHVRLDLETGAELPPSKREALIRIAREAISNAGRHSNSEVVMVRLSVNGSVRLAVSDNGVGFEMDENHPDCFGLISMRERAEALDAEFSITSAPGRGTTVEVAL